MRPSLLILGLICAASLGLLWLMGGLATLERVLEAAQRDMQGHLAAAVRALRGGNPGALLALMVASFSYGVVHAAGPGHGKVLIAGYGMGRRVPVLRLSALALASSQAQSGVAIALVFAGLSALGWTREQMVGLTDNIMTPISYGAILLLGLWLVWRGTARLRRQTQGTDAGQSESQSQGGQGHDHAHDAHCGHAHGPSLDQAARVTSLREALGLIAGIAIRPCTGALFLLILTWQIGIFGAGIAGVLAMGLGTATVTIGVAAMTVWAREGTLASLPGARIAQAMPVMELAAGLVVALVAGQLLLRSL